MGKNNSNQRIICEQVLIMTSQKTLYLMCVCAEYLAKKQKVKGERREEKMRWKDRDDGKK